MSKKFHPTWEQLKEIRNLCEAIYQAHAVGATDGKMANTIITGKWDGEDIEIKIDLEAED